MIFKWVDHTILLKFLAKSDFSELLLSWFNQTAVDQIAWYKILSNYSFVWCTSRSYYFTYFVFLASSVLQHAKLLTFAGCIQLFWPSIIIIMTIFDALNFNFAIYGTSVRLLSFLFEIFVLDYLVILACSLVKNSLDIPCLSSDYAPIVMKYYDYSVWLIIDVLPIVYSIHKTLFHFCLPK